MHVIKNESDNSKFVKIMKISLSKRLYPDPDPDTDPEVPDATES
jgi:hypothetical protein